MNKLYRNIILLAIAVISIGMHWQHFPKEIISFHSWRQTQTQSTINNFYEENMNIFNPRRNDRGNGDGIFRMEFPLMQWLVAGTYKVTGQHLIVSRIFNFLTGLLSILALFLFLKLLFRNETLALIGAWAFNFSPSFYCYTIVPLPDNFALCCSLWGIAFFMFWYRHRKTHQLLLSGFFLSVGTLCKMPFVLYYSLPFTFFLIKIIEKGFKKDIIQKIIIVSLFLPLPVAWYASVIPHWGGNGIVKGILSNAVPFSTLLYYWKHNLISTLPELLLNYGALPLFLAGIYFTIKNKTYKKKYFVVFAVWGIALIGYYFFESNAIGTPHDYYLFPFFPLLFILVSYGANQLIKTKKKHLIALVILLLLLLPFTAYLRNVDRWNPDNSGFNKDLFTYKDELRNAVPKDALCIAGNDLSHFIFFYYIDKKGWGFDYDLLNAEEIKKMIANGAQYLYSDSRLIDENESIKPLLGNLVLERGSIRIFKLSGTNTSE